MRRYWRRWLGVGWRRQAGTAPLAPLGAAALLWGVACLSGAGAEAEAGGFAEVHMRIAVPRVDGIWDELDLKLLLLIEPGHDVEEEAEIAREGMLARFPGAIDLESGSVAAQHVETGYSWVAHSATWTYNPAGKPPDLGSGDQAIADAAATWNGAGGADWSFMRGPDSSAGASLCANGTPDGETNVAWVPSLPGSTLATTCTLFPRQLVKESDIALDASRDWTTDPAEIVVDLQSVALHEFGHMLGLAHSADSNAVMFGTYSRRTNKRDLTTDDLAGLVTIYGAALAEPTPAETPTAAPTEMPSETPAPILPVPRVLVPGLVTN
jgi:hypothetical protein